MTTTSPSATADYPGSWELAAAAATLASGLPPELAPLARLAYNYRWSWEPGRRGRLPRPRPARLGAQRAATPCASSPTCRSTAQSWPLADRGACASESRRSRPRSRPTWPAAARRSRASTARSPSSAPSSACTRRSRSTRAGWASSPGTSSRRRATSAIPFVGVGLLYRRGYFHQRVDRTGMQQEYWLQLFPERTPAVQLTQEGGGPLELEFELFGRSVAFHVWRVDVGRVPLYLLDTDLPRNDAIERWITSRLYEGNSAIRLGPVRPARHRRCARAARARDRAGRAALQRGPPRAGGARAGGRGRRGRCSARGGARADAESLRVHDAHSRAGRERDVPARAVPRRLPRAGGPARASTKSDCSTCAGPIREATSRPG